MSRRTRIQVFYESFVNAVYGFVLVIGFQQFVTMPAKRGPIEYVLLVTAYLTVLHYWLIFVASTEDTFRLILSEENETEGTRIGWFWMELLFATAMIVPMLALFAAMSDVQAFAKGLLLIAIMSLGWDAWAFALHRFQKKRASAQTPPAAHLGRLLMRWIGLDLIFVLTMLLLVATLTTSRGGGAVIAAWALLAITATGAALNTIVIAPSLFLGADTGDEAGTRLVNPRQHSR